MSTARTVTPPSCPIYNVQLTKAEIEGIVTISLKNVISVTSEALPSGSSYNNRIYAVEVAHGSHFSRLILKVSGWPVDWKHFKVKNEVLSLSLVKKYCPEIPVPKVVACCNGLVTAIQGDENILEQLAPKTGKEWILMSRLLGHSISGSGLSAKEHDRLRCQVAEAFAALRIKIPMGKSIGNFRLDDSSIQYINLADRISLGELFNFPDAIGAPYSTLVEYYRGIFINEVTLAEKYHEVMKPNLSLIAKVRTFISDKLPLLSIFSDPELPLNAFTHGDFSDRNLLYVRDNQEDSVNFSGWVDWEFAGYHNPFEEFLMLENEEEFVGRSSYELLREDGGGGTRSSLDGFYKLLDNLGVNAPLQETKHYNAIRKHWNTARHLYQLQSNIIPWFVRVRWDAGEKENLSVEVQRAGKNVEDALQWFEKA